MAETAKVLEKVELGHLAEHLDEEGPWDQILSGGEKQRLAFARLFLHRQISSCSTRRPLPSTHAARIV
jgi:putative ATP-binding cassette transporter